MSVHKKLMEARIKLQNAPLKKTGENKFAGYKYFELGDFLPTVQVIFSELGLCGVVSYTQDMAKLTITNTEDGTSLEITSPMGSAALKGCHEVQNIGAVETYQRRYLWITAMEVIEHDVLDAVTGGKSGEPAEIKHQSVPKDSWDLLTAKEQKYLTDLAIPIKDEISAGNMERAYELRMQVQFDEDRHDFQQAGFISLFSPPERTALKKYRESISMKKAA